MILPVKDVDCSHFQGRQRYYQVIAVCEWFLRAPTSSVIKEGSIVFKEKKIALQAFNPGLNIETFIQLFSNENC